MNVLNLTSAAALALGSVLATACANEGPDSYSDPTTESAAAEGTVDLGAETAAVDLTGQSVFDASGTQVGTVASVVTEADGSQAAVISVGSYLGMGDKSIHVPASELTANADQSGLTISMTADEIEAAPEHQEDAPTYMPPEEDSQ